MDFGYKPYVDPEFELLIEELNPPRVCIDNDSCPDCTLVKVDSANKHGMLLEMVQVLTDLDLLISKSYISSDGGWLMDVFHVTDRHRRKITNQSLIQYIQQAICATRRESREMQVNPCGRGDKDQQVDGSTCHTALEMTGMDRPGIISEISAVLAELRCHVSSAVAWTHNTRAACILYVEDELKGGAIMDPSRAAQVQSQLKNVIEAHHNDGEQRSVRLAARRTHTERRLHQLMAADRDYEQCCSCSGSNCIDYKVEANGQRRVCQGTRVNIESCEEKGYSIVTVRSRDRPKLLFDTVCTLTDMQYVVFHAAISSKNSIAFQEYYIRHKDGCILSSELERIKVAQCLIAATERRVSQGLKLEICTKDRVGLLSDVTRIFRENGLSISRAEIRTSSDGRAVGTFYVRDTSGQQVKPEILENIKTEIGGDVLVVDEPSSRSPQKLAISSMSRSNTNDAISRSNGNDTEDGEANKSRPSLGNLFWSQLERLSSNLRSIRS